MPYGDSTHFTLNVLVGWVGTDTGRSGFAGSEACLSRTGPTPGTSKPVVPSLDVGELVSWRLSLLPAARRDSEMGF